MEGTEEEQGSRCEGTRGPRGTREGEKRPHEAAAGGIRLWLRSGIPYMGTAREEAEGQGDAPTLTGGVYVDAEKTAGFRTMHYVPHYMDPPSCT